MHGNLFEGLFRNARTDIYNIMCYITAHDRQNPIYVGDTSSSSGRAIPKNSTTIALNSLGAIINFIDYWIKHFQHNYQEILMMYHKYMIELFKQTPTLKSKPLSQY